MNAHSVFAPSLFDGVRQRLEQILSSATQETGLLVLHVPLGIAETPRRVLVSQELASFWFEAPDRDAFLFGAGSAWARSRFILRPDPPIQAVQRFLVSGSDGEHLRLVGGAAFPNHQQESAGLWTGTPAVHWRVPEVLWQGEQGRTSLTLAVWHDGLRDIEAMVARWQMLFGRLQQDAGSGDTPVLLSTDDEPSRDAYMHLVDRARRAIAKTSLQKVVLARSVRVEAATAFDPSQVLDRLRRHQPSAISFAIGFGERWFLGATPERLLRVENGLVQTVALAGSAARAQDTGTDHALGESLLLSRKDRGEHAIVVTMLRETFEKHCDDVRVDDGPSLLRLAGVQHLATAIAGRARDRSTLWRLVPDLHPTPAVGGQPRAAALRWLKQQERMSRGWYAGILGWCAPNGDGELAVAIRSLLLCGREAMAYAGCGIVADSDPKAELLETDLKLRPALTALGVPT